MKSPELPARHEPYRMLVDTNVWLDYYSGLRPKHETACRLIDEALRRGVVLLYAVASSKDVFFLVGADYKKSSRAECGGVPTEDAASAAREMAWGCVRHMGEIATAVGCDASDVWLAQKYKRIHDDYEDDLVLAAAVRAEVDLLVTNDARLLKHAPLNTQTTEDAVTYLEMLGA